MSGYSKRFKMLRTMQPVKMWIDGTSFNIRTTRKLKDQSENDKAEYGLHEQHELYNISKDDNGKLTTLFRVPSAYYIKLCGNKDFNVNTLQESTKTEVNIPKDGKDGNISISGDDYDNVAKAREEMHNLLSQVRNRYPAMQFISIPTLSEDVQNNFKKFKDEVLNCDVKVSGMEESIFQKPEKLHLTIAVLSLLDNVEKEEAIKTLNSFKEEIWNEQFKNRGPLMVKLQGIDCMDQNYKKAGVMYAKATFAEQTDDFSLQKVANSLATYFYEKGLLREYVENVKIHVTLVNTKYRNTKDSSKRWRSFKRIPFDATYIMEKYKDHDFGVTIFDSIHLSLISSKGEDGFYLPLSIIKI